MLIEQLRRMEVLGLNRTTTDNVIRIIGDWARVTSDCRVTVQIFTRIGNNVTIELGENSKLIINEGVTIGAKFVVEIKGREAEIICHKKGIPKDAKLTPVPR